MASGIVLMEKKRLPVKPTVALPCFPVMDQLPKPAYIHSPLVMGSEIVHQEMMNTFVIYPENAPQPASA